jgi:hypothetical protein
MERDQAEALAAADRERQMAQTAQRRAREVAAVEASVRRAALPPAAAEPATAPQVGFDPVVGVALDPAGMSQVQLQRELQLAWSLTKDRRYLKLLRQVRRMR